MGLSHRTLSQTSCNLSQLLRYLLQNLKMKIYKDVFSGDELFSDTYPMKLVDNCMYEVYGKHITRTDDDIQLEGSNASAEEADEGTESNSVSGVDLVLNHRLVETGLAARRITLSTLKTT